SLSPLFPIWTYVRNLAYLCFVILFIFIGFMIMFRIKIKAQTVATIQNTIPRIIIAIILITFSYAIAGFLIDLMYVVIGIFVYMGLTLDPCTGHQTSGFLAG